MEFNTKGKSMEEQLLSFSTNNANKCISIDTEGSSLRYDDYELWGFSCSNGHTTIYIDVTTDEVEEEKALEFLQRWVDEANMVFMHNAPYDMKVLHKYGVSFDNTKVFDTMSAAHNINNRLRKGLKWLSKEQLGIEYEEDFSEASSHGHSSSNFYYYGKLDAYCTYKLGVMFYNMLEKRGQLEFFLNVEVPYQKVLAEMAINGIDVDVEEMKKRDHIENLLTSMRSKMAKQAGLKTKKQYVYKKGGSVDIEIKPVHKDGSRFNFDSTKQLGWLLYEHLDLPVPSTTDSGQPSTSASALKDLKGEHPLIETLLEYRTYSKLYSSFLTKLGEFVQSDGKIRPNFNNCGTSTGRLSSSNPNVQQLPSKPKGEVNIRKIFIAPKGYKMIACDFSGQENRIIAMMCDEENMKDIIKNNKDLHLVNAKSVFDLDVPDEKLVKTHPDYPKIKKKYKENGMRLKGKIFSYGIPYGAGTYRLMKEFDVSEKKAEKFLEKYYNTFPNIKKEKEKTVKDLENQGYVENMFGRRRYFKEYTTKYGNTYYSSKAKRAAFNFRIQGSGADMMRVASNKVYMNKKDEWELKQVMTVHDENVYIVKEEYVDEAAKFIKKCFETCVNTEIPMKSDVDIGNNYAEAK